MGTSLALVGAYILAGELGPAEALTPNTLSRHWPTTHRLMRPYVDKCQDLPHVSTVMRRNSASELVTAQVMKWMQRWPFRSLAERKWFTTADAIELPDY